jgi:hypothetical protein
MVRSGQRRQILVLHHQIAVLQRHVKTPRSSWADRAILSALAQLIPGRQRSQLRLIASSRTLLRWHADIVKRRRCYPHRRPGRPPVPRSVRDLVLEMARDNPAWGYRRSHGELTGLGYTLAPSTVWKILNDAGIAPAPNRHVNTGGRVLEPHRISAATTARSAQSSRGRELARRSTATRAAAPAAPRPWRPTNDRAGPASRRAGRRSGTAGEGTRLIIMAHCWPCRIAAAHRMGRLLASADSVLYRGKGVGRRAGAACGG